LRACSPAIAGVALALDSPPEDDIDRGREPQRWSATGLGDSLALAIAL
jgi:hypothetical protein